MQRVMELDVSDAVFFPFHNESDLFSPLLWCADIYRLTSCLTLLRSNSLFSKLLSNASLNIGDMERIDSFSASAAVREQICNQMQNCPLSFPSALKNTFLFFMAVHTVSILWPAKTQLAHCKYILHTAKVLGDVFFFTRTNFNFFCVCG